jgi:hypothetical protein
MPNVDEILAQRAERAALKRLDDWQRAQKLTVKPTAPAPKPQRQPITLERETPKPEKPKTVFTLRDD